jgi:hypothetical protein
MAAGTYDFVIEQGTSFKLSFIYKDSLGQPIDITDWCARLTWKSSGNNSTQVFISTNTDSSYSFYIDGPAGKGTLLFPASTTNDFSFSHAKYDLELQSPDDLYTGGGKYTVRILMGSITISKRNSSSNDKLECNE